MDGERRRRRGAEENTRPSGRELERKAHALLRHGEVLFQTGSYQQAIHVWTRILFLDRGNVEAREAIDRAKRAQAEKQRKLDMMFVEAAELLETGDRQQARRRLARILAMDPRHSEGRSLWEKMEALERRGDAPSGSQLLSDPGEGKTSKLRRRRAAGAKLARGENTRSSSAFKVAAFLFCAFCLLGIGGFYLHLNWDFLVSDQAFSPSRQASLGSLDHREQLPLPQPAELHYYNGARLYAKGHYREALSELTQVHRQSGFFQEARSLILRIEERLLRGTITSESTDSELQETARADRARRK